MRLAFITPHYGAEIVEGAEHACRLLAEQVAQRHDVEVLTSTVRHASGRYGRTEGSDRVRGVLVRRFAAAGPFDRRAFEQFSARLSANAHSRADEIEWTRRLGPWTAGLFDFLRRYHRNYDALVFFSHHHATTVQGLTVAPERSILFPWLQLTPSLRFGLARETLATVPAIGYFSATERHLLRARMRGALPYEEMVGIGVNAPPEQRYPRLEEGEADAEGDETRPEGDENALRPHLGGRGVPFRRRHRLDGRFVLYGGRVDSDNGSEELIEYFDSFASSDGDTALVLMGVKLMKLPAEPYLRLAGVLPARERMAAFEAADVTAAPNPNDLLAEAVLESFAVGTAVLASARNLAAVEHCRRAGAGLYYGNREEFVEALRMLTTNERLRETLGRNGRTYVAQHFRWDAVIERFERLLSRVKSR